MLHQRGERSFVTKIPEDRQNLVTKRIRVTVMIKDIKEDVYQNLL